MDSKPFPRPGLGSRLRVALVRALLGAFGWRLVGTPPDVRRCVIAFAPHTSNWDFVLLMLVRIAFGRHAAYLIKHTMRRFPLGLLFQWTGGIFVERSEHHHLVAQLVKTFSQRSDLWLAMAPEGTRARTESWKSGFYHLARRAEVPVQLAFVDAARRECGLGPLVSLSGDVARDFDQLRAFYADKRGIVPERAGPIRLHPSDHPLDGGSRERDESR